MRDLWLDFVTENAPQRVHQSALGQLLGASWRLLGASWTLLGRSWALLGRAWAILDLQGSIWSPPGSPLGRFGILL